MIDAHIKIFFNILGSDWVTMLDFNLYSRV